MGAKKRCQLDLSRVPLLLLLVSSLSPRLLVFVWGDRKRETKMLEHFRRDSYRPPDRPKTFRDIGGTQGRESVLVVLWIKPAPPIPRRDHRTRRVPVQKELRHPVLPQSRAQVEPLPLPRASYTGVRRLARHVVGTRREQPEHTERLQVGRQRRGRAPMQSQPVRRRHRTLPSPPSPRRASPRVGAASPATRGGKDRGGPAGLWFAPSSSRASRRPTRAP